MDLVEIEHYTGSSSPVSFRFASSSFSLPRSRSLSLSLDWEFESDQENVFFILFLPPFCLLNFVIYCANVWNEREADNARERRDFEEDEVKSHLLGLSSAQPFI